MRRAIYVAAALAVAAAAPEFGRSLLASVASSLFECAPYLAGATVLQHLLRGRARWLTPYLGCGCEAGPAARSIPAAFATAVLFGPLIATARIAGALIASAATRRHGNHHHPEAPLGGFVRIVPSAAIAAVVLQMMPLLHVSAQSTPMQWALGAVLGFFAAPCALGAVAVAGALHAQSAPASMAFLCVAGIVDVRVWHPVDVRCNIEDGLAYILLALCAAVICMRHGAMLVNPRLSVPMAGAALTFLVCAWHYRDRRAAIVRCIPAAMLAALVLGAPAPAYYATETTLSDGYAGERITFTGMLVGSHATASLVRYAITCCRADAQPVAVALSRPPRNITSRWLRASGILEERHGSLELVAYSLRAISPPLDPFVYR